MVPIARFGNEQAAHMVKNRLESEGVESVVVGGNSHAIYGGLVFPVELHAAEADRAGAQALIQEMAKDVYRGACPSCGYDTEGVPDGAPCPECGAEERLPTLKVELIGPGGGNGLAWAVIIVVSGIALAGVISAVINN